MLRRAGGRFDPIAARSRRDAAPAPALCCHAGDAGCARVGMQRPMASFASAAIIPGERNGVFKNVRRREKPASGALEAGPARDRSMRRPSWKAGGRRVKGGDARLHAPRERPRAAAGEFKRARAAS
ncbi:hypothetical protein C7S13_8393 [Burkholderia cepacia]|nr:hypothetical protein [Burkholderia cepacia]